MITPPLARAKAGKPAVSVWHMNIGDLLGRGGARVPPGELAIFCNETAFLLGAGVTVQNTLSILAGNCPGRVLPRVLPEMHNRVLQGESLSDAMAAARVFPVFMRGFIKVGEQTARLERVFEQLAVHYEQQSQTRGELAAVFAYPAAVMTMMLGVIIMAVAVVLPGYADMFAASGVALPVLTRGLLVVSDFVITYGAVLGAGLGAFVFFMAAFLRSRAGRAFFAWLQLRFSLYRRQVNLRVAQTLALMLQAGQPLSGILPLCTEIIDNVRVKRDLVGIGNDLAAGRPFWAVLEGLAYIDPLFVSMARVGEESGRLPQTMTQCCVQFEQRYRTALRRANKLAEPLITLGMGMLLAIVMLAIILPTFRLATAV